MEPGVNKAYFEAAIRSISGLRYYYGDLEGDTVAYLRRYFPYAVEAELRHATKWAIADVFGDGCEVETEEES